MNLFQIASNRFVVLAVCGDDWSCQVLEGIAEAGARYPSLAAEMNALLELEAPRSGPPFDQPYRAAWLEPPVFEFKSNFGRIAGLRVTAFFDYLEDPTAIVCAEAFLKDSNPPLGWVPPILVEKLTRTKRVVRQYAQARRNESRKIAILR
jgi:hypothetical protein